MLRKQLLYLTSERLCAYRWHAGRLTAGPAFGHDPAGRQALLAYLGEGDGAPAWLLADLAEEDFQRQLLPHAGGAAGRHLRARRLARLYHDTPLRYCTVQGRDDAGRRDDRVLLCALTRPALVLPWVAALEQAGVPLAGVYSAPLLGAALARQLAPARQHLLLVTQQSAGLRQSYFEAGQLKFSRLTPVIAHDGAAAGIAAEAERMRQFLASARLLARGARLDTLVLAPDGQHAPLRAHCHDSTDIAYHFSSLEAAGARLGLAATTPLADPLLLALLGRRAGASHYTLAEPARFYLWWRARRCLRAGNAALLAGAALWLGFNLWAMVDADAASARLQAQARRDTAAYHAAMATLPPAPASARNMKAAVLLASALAARAPQPAPMLALLGAALEAVPQIRLSALDWKAGAGAPAPQILRVEAEVALQADGYRSALVAMQLLARQLSRHPGLSVVVEQPPLDLRPSVKLSGKAGPAAAGASASFILNLRWQRPS